MMLGVQALGKTSLALLGLLGVGLYAYSRRSGDQAVSPAPAVEPTYGPVLTQAVEAAKNVGTGEKSYVFYSTASGRQMAMGRGAASLAEYRNDVKAGNTQ